MPEHEKKEIILAKKENSYHLILINLIDSLSNNEEKLRKQFLSNLSESILKLTLTDDLQISGMIHGLIINFMQSFKSIINYFNDFVEFFNQTRTENQPQTVSLIYFISTVLKIVNYFLFSNIPSGSTLTIEGDLHFQICNIIFFWIQNMKENKSNKNDNILFLLVKALKNINFLIILKIIYLGILKFLLEKKEINEKNYDEIFDHILQINPNFFKIDTLINENGNNPIFSGFRIVFKEDASKSYNFDANNINYFIEILFKLIKKVEKKINKYGRFSEEEFLERRNNLLFFEFKYKYGKINNLVNEKPELFSNQMMSEVNNNIVDEYLKYYKIHFQEFKLSFYRQDLFENFEKCGTYYDEFKKKLDEINLLRFLYILSSQNKTLEASIILQYLKKVDYDLAYKLLKRNLEYHNVDKLEYIWKIPYYELLSNSYYNINKQDHLNEVFNLMKRISNHQFFKKHPLRKIFKILNLFKFIENLSI